jgi:hypothetical protein
MSFSESTFAGFQAFQKKLGTAGSIVNLQIPVVNSAGGINTSLPTAATSADTPSGEKFQAVQQYCERYGILNAYPMQVIVLPTGGANRGHPSGWVSFDDALAYCGVK